MIASSTNPSLMDPRDVNKWACFQLDYFSLRFPFNTLPRTATEAFRRLWGAVGELGSANFTKPGNAKLF